MEVPLPKKALCGAATTLNGQEVRCTSSFEDYEHNVDTLALECSGRRSLAQGA